ncbi:MAG TPA: hypothetical protein DCZ95_04750 [Verrucomicrobia bacterium]|nr:hypothetical protein [Verrucomicrobiota bacterium]
MRAIRYAEPVIEPISLAEFKLHLRLDSGSTADNIGELQCLAIGSHAIADNYTTHVGTAIDTLGYSVLVILNSGTNGAGGTVDTKIQESENGTDWTDFSGGAFTQVTEANDNAIQEKAYTGSMRYVRTASKVLVGACVFGTTAIRFAASSEEDSQLTDCIQEARDHIEDITRRALLTQTWDVFLDGWPRSNSIKLPFGNLQSVTHLKYTDSAGAITTMAVTTDYIVETNGDQCGRIVLPYGESWPSFTAYPSNPITVRFICGWTAASSLPRKIRAACKLIATDLWQNREGKQFGGAGSDYRVNVAVNDLLASARLWDEVV